MIKAYHLNPQDYKQSTLPCLLLITKADKYLVWAEGITKNLDLKFVLIKYKENEIKEFYEIYEMDNDEYIKRARYNEPWVAPLLNLIQKMEIDQLEEINPQQYLTHENLYLRELIKEII